MVACVSLVKINKGGELWWMAYSILYYTEFAAFNPIPSHPTPCRALFAVLRRSQLTLANAPYPLL